MRLQQIEHLLSSAVIDATPEEQATLVAAADELQRLYEDTADQVNDLRHINGRLDEQQQALAEELRILRAGGAA